jgi:ABC-type transport system involved in cytochrome bd biosynthesis fused ATPase/permease subunit
MNNERTATIHNHYDKIIIVITHRLEHLEDFDRIYRLEEGILREVSM